MGRLTIKIHPPCRVSFKIIFPLCNLITSSAILNPNPTCFLSDRAFGGADTLSTSKTIASFFEKGTNHNFTFAWRIASGII